MLSLSQNIKRFDGKLKVLAFPVKTSPSKPLFRNVNVLNVYQINIFQSVQFMHKIKNKKYSACLSKTYSVYHAILIPPTSP